MKRIFFPCLIMLAIGVSCEPHNTNFNGSQVWVDVKCDTCYLAIHNTYYYNGHLSNSGSTASAHVNDSIHLIFFRYMGESCFKVTDFQNYGSDTAWLYIIENNDTIGVEMNTTTNQCY